MRAKLEPYLGFLHSLQEGKPSLVCDLEELYRHLTDDFLIQYCRDLKPKDFVPKTEILSKGKQAKRECLDETRTKSLFERLNGFFESTIEIPRIRVGRKQTLETLINEEALLLGKFLREERSL